MEGPSVLGCECGRSIRWERGGQGWGLGRGKVRVGGGSGGDELVFTETGLNSDLKECSGIESRWPYSSFKFVSKMSSQNSSSPSGIKAHGD
jgi:hypothetical protein